MSFSFNKVIIGGNLTRDVEVRYLANDKAVGGFGIAVNHTYKSKDGEKKEDVTFVDIECWGKTAELAGQYLAKGRACLVEGKLKLESWDDKETGQKRSRLKVVADTIQFVGGKDAEREAAPQRTEPTRPKQEKVADDSDSPPF